MLFYGGTCFGFQLAVQINGVPMAADKIFVLADGEGLTVPLGSISSVPPNTPKVTQWIPSVSMEHLRLRAIAFAGKSLFPTVSAIGMTTYSTGQMASPEITMGWSMPLVQKMADSDGTTTLLVTFGDVDFFHRADAAELWIDGSISRRNCTGSHYLAPLFKTEARWYALFLVPTRLLSPGVSIQLAYHALDFKASEQIPLLVWPNRDLNEPPLRIESFGTRRAFGGLVFHDQRLRSETRRVDQCPLPVFDAPRRRLLPSCLGLNQKTMNLKERSECVSLAFSQPIADRL
jgi:hypothetical protein